MPNWCFTTYTISGEPGKINRITSAIQRIKDRNRKNSRLYAEKMEELTKKGIPGDKIAKELYKIPPHTDVWLVDILRELGVSEKDMEIPCNLRGFINDNSEEDGVLTLSCSTASENSS